MNLVTSEKIVSPGKMLIFCDTSRSERSKLASETEIDASRADIQSSL